MPGELSSLHTLGEILRKDTPAFLQLLVLIPVTLLHAHEPAFILRRTGAPGCQAPLKKPLSGNLPCPSLCTPKP